MIKNLLFSVRYADNSFNLRPEKANIDGDRNVKAVHIWFQKKVNFDDRNMQYVGVEMVRKSIYVGSK